MDATGSIHSIPAPTLSTPVRGKNGKTPNLKLPLKVLELMVGLLRLGFPLTLPPRVLHHSYMPDPIPDYFLYYYIEDFTCSCT